MKVGTVVVGYDGSDNAKKAIDAAADLVEEDGVVHVVTAFEQPSAGDTARLLESLPEEFRTSYDMLAGPRRDLHDAEMILEERGVNYKAHFVDDDAAGAILDVADRTDADLIVVGSRGLRRGTRFLRGSVSTRVAGHARHSFFIVHD